jgi:hypothetical protein
MLAIDQAKAFDTISNNYMLQAYKFFGFGPNMIKILTVLGTGRSACIGFDDGTCSTPFPLDRGRTQGNGPSPCEYNIGQQILLFKIELCPEVASVYNHMHIPRTISGTLGHTHSSVSEAVINEDDIRFSHESSGKTDKAEAFADDTTAITLFNYQCLKAIKSMLDDFAVISGLKCNIDKTSLLQIGVQSPATDEILSLGFSLVDSIKVLGMDFKNSTAALTDNFVPIQEKIRTSIAFWERFNLSLPGRINITKSLLVSLLNHLGCFLQPDRVCIRNIQHMLDSFTKGSLNVAANRICLPVEAGGLGMINIEEFLTSQQASWIFRCFNSCRDNWRVDIIELCNGNPFQINPEFICKARHPILHCIANSFTKLRINFDRSNENYFHSFFMYHPIFYRDRGDKRMLTYEALGSGNT